MRYIAPLQAILLGAFTATAQLLVKTSWTFMYENSSLFVKATENGHGNHR